MRDSKGMQLLNFVSNNNLAISNTFYQNKSHATCKSFNSKGSSHQTNYILVLVKIKEYIERCKALQELLSHSDYSVALTLLRPRAQKWTNKFKKMNWYQLIDAKIREKTIKSYKNGKTVSHYVMRNTLNAW